MVWRTLLTCCDDYREYLGDVGYNELIEKGIEHINDKHKKECDLKFDAESITNGVRLRVIPLDV